MRSAAVTDWSAARPGSLSPGEIHVWRFPLQAPVIRTPVLTPAELERLAGFARPGRKRSWFNSRRALRTLLGHYLEQPPSSLEFRAGERGKPFLPGHPLHFNLSHSGRWGLLAVALDFPLGVDLEAIRPVRDPLRLARRMFPADEQEALARCAPEELERRFFELWTLMEAQQKLTGAGIFGQAATADRCRTLSFLADADHAAALAWPASLSPAPATAFFQFNAGKG